MKTCSICGRSKNLSSFYKTVNHGRPYVLTHCRNCKRELSKKHREKIRTQVLAHYGNQCQCCQESNPVFLTIDHINNDGASHRKSGVTTSALATWIIKNGFPKEFQILCYNCNIAKSILGSCPHNEGKKMSGVR